MITDRDTVISHEVLSKIKDILKNNPKGMSVTGISKKMNMNRNSVAKYLDILSISGFVEMKSYGTAKVFYLSHRVPISAMVSFTSDLIAVLDGNQKIIQVNDAFLDFLGIKREDVIGKRFAEAEIPLFSGTEIYNRLSDLPPKKQFSTEIEYGSERSFHVFRVKLVPTVFDDGGWGTTIICEDFTEERKGKEALQMSEARYRAIVEDQPDLICRFRPDFTILFVNQALCRFFDRRETAFIGKSIIEFMGPDQGEALKEKVFALTPERPIMTLEARIPAPGDGYQSSPGRIRWLSWTTRGLFDSGGTLIEIQGTGRDITKQKLLGMRESLLKKNLEFLKQAATDFIDLSPDSDIYATIVNHCTAIVPGATIVISVFDRDNATMVIRAIRETPLREDDGTLLAGDLIGKELFIPPALLAQLAHWIHFEHITPENASALFMCIEGAIPSLPAILAANNSYTISLIARQALLGNFFFVTPEKISPEDCALIEAYVHTAAGALRRRFAEDAQKMSEERFRAMADLSPFPVAIISPKGRYLYVNRQFTEVFGYTLQDITTGKEWFENAFPDPVKRAEAIAAWKSDLAGSAIGKVRPRIFRVRCRNGKDREILFRPVTLADRNEYITFEDITDQREAEKEIRAANQKMQDIIEFLPDPTLVIDTEKKVIAWNRAMEELTGFARKDMIGKGDYEYAIPFYGERRPMLIDIVDHPDPGIESLYTSLWRPEEGVVIGEGFLPRFKGGKGLFAQGKASVLYNLQGERVGAIQSIRDLTHRREMEEELKRSYAEMDQRVRERTDELARANTALENEIKRCNAIEASLRQQESFYHSIAESFNDYIFVVDRNDVLKYINPFMKSRFRVQEGDVMRGGGPDHFLEKYVDKLSLLVQSVIETGNLVHEELGTDSPSGQIILDTWLAPMRDDRGRLYAVLCIARDVTEFKRLQAKLARTG